MAPATAASSSSSSSGSEAEAETQAQAQEQEAQAAQPGEKLGAAVPPQGRGAKDALREMIREEDTGAFSYDITEDDLGNVHRVVWHRTSGEDVVFDRPDKTDDDDWLLWRMMEKGRLAMKVNAELLDDLRKVSSLVEPYREEPPPPLMVNVKTGKIIARADHDRRDQTMPERIYFHTKKLADAVTQKIEHTYFLEIEELIADVHGNKYHPMDEDVGSMCATAGFPHAIAFQKEKGRGKAKPTLEYVVAASNTVELNVRLKKRERAGKGKSTDTKTVDASEAELIELIGSQRTVGQMQDDLNYEKDMMLYVALEFADGDDTFARVPPSCFVQEPLLGALFSPAESAPYKGGFYEFPMTRGTASINFRIAKGVTTFALKKVCKGRQFRFVVKALNPYLCGLAGFTARTRGFCIKGVLHNDAKSQERYVKTKDGVRVSCEADCPEEAPKRGPPKKKQKAEKEE